MIEEIYPNLKTKIRFEPSKSHFNTTNSKCSKLSHWYSM